MTPVLPPIGRDENEIAGSWIVAILLLIALAGLSLAMDGATRPDAATVAADRGSY